MLSRTQEKAKMSVFGFLPGTSCNLLGCPEAFYPRRTQNDVKELLPLIEYVMVGEPLHQPVAEEINWASDCMHWDFQSVDSYGFL